MFKKIKQLKNTKLWATTINFLIIAVLVNFLVRLFPFNLDLSQDKSHSLTKETKKVLLSLDDIVNIEVFLSSNLPPQLAPAENAVKNMLYQYQKNSNDKIKIQFSDPQKDVQTEQRANSLGLTPLQFSTVKKDQFEMLQGYFGLVISYAGETEMIPVLQEINNLEYHLTSKIKKIQDQQLETVAVLIDSQTSQQKPMAIIQKLLSERYQVLPVSPDAEELPDPDIFQTLIVFAPEEKLPEKIITFIDQMIVAQKGVFIMLDPIVVGQGMQMAQIETGLESLVKNYGIEIGNKLIADPSSSFASFQTSLGNFLLPYPLWVKTIAENGNSQIPITTSLESVVFPWVSSLHLSNDAQSLWMSTKQAIELDQSADISPSQEWPFEQKQGQEQFVLAALQKKLSKDGQEKEIKLVVTADSDFIIDQIISNSPENAQFFMNTVDYLCQDTDLINIRSKMISSRPLKQISEDQKQIMKIIVLATGPAILLTLAIIVRWKRKRK